MKLKKLLFILCFVTAINGQAQSYTFSTTTATYSDLLGSTSLNGTATWDDPSYAIPIGFNFQYFGETLTTIYINELYVGGGLSNTPSLSGVAPLLQAYGADIIDRGYDFAVDEAPTGSLSTISYLQEGAEGDRILKIEWNNVGFFGDVEINGATSSNFTNFQLWLYENNSVIEVHFGPNSIPNPNLAFDDETGTFITLIEELDVDNETLGSGGAYILTGSPSNPTFSNVTTLEDVATGVLNGVIPNGTVYQFNNTTLSIDEFDATQLKIFPNPSTDFITISGLKQEENYAIYNILGHKIGQGTFINNETLNIEAFSSGLYLVKFENGNSIKFLKS